jgi:hypothetical protein
MADEWRVGRHPVCAWTSLTCFAFVRSRPRHLPVAPAEEYTREAYQERDGQHIGSTRVPQTTSQYTCCLSSARGHGSNQGHKRRTGLHWHHPALSARAEMTATTGASHPRTVRVHPKHGSHTMVSSARVGVVFSTWTCVCFSGGGAVRESQPSLQHALVPQSHTLCCERQGGVAGGVCTPVLARHAGTPRRSIVYPRNGRKKARISAASASGCSRAAKWPPRSMGVQRWMLNTRSAIERGGRTISRGKSL